MMREVRHRRGPLMLAVALLACGCDSGDGGNSPPIAASAVHALAEDIAVRVDLSATDPDNDLIRYQVQTSPAHGSVTAAIDGQLTYLPNPDYHGSDTFTFVAIDSRGARSNIASITLNVLPVNDPPLLLLAEVATNSAYDMKTAVPYSVVDPDSEDDIRVTLENSDPAVAEVLLKEVDSSLEVLPRQYGTTDVSLTVTDGEYTVKRTIAFTVKDVDKVASVHLAQPDSEAIHVANVADESVSFQLTHNGFTSFQSTKQLVEYIRSIPDAYPGQPFERKLWRFLIENVVHDYPLSENQWLMDPLVTINSLGWGFCSNVASAFTRIAQEAGMEARVWGLGGHVVPEVRASDGTWQMYDPDLAVYYRNANGKVASIMDLEAQPYLIAEPTSPLFEIGPGTPYSPYVASIYASTDDNAVDNRFLGPSDVLDGTVVLPPGASLVYPGQWDDAPTGYDLNVPHDVSYFRHAQISVPAGWVGTVQLPWMLRKVSGEGRIRVLDQDFQIGDAELASRLAAPGEFAKTLQILDSQSNITLTFYINAIRFAVDSENVVVLKGRNVWALETHAVALEPRFARGLHIPRSALKPVPPVWK